MKKEKLFVDLPVKIKNKLRRIGRKEARGNMTAALEMLIDDYSFKRGRKGADDGK